MKRSSTTAVALPNRFERRRERTRQELLAAATRVLAEKGLHQTKIIDIAYDDFKQQSPPNIEPSRQGAENILAQFPGGSSKLDDYVDTGILDGLRAEGFFAQMQRKYGGRQ